MPLFCESAGCLFQVIWLAECTSGSGEDTMYCSSSLGASKKLPCGSMLGRYRLSLYNFTKWEGALQSHCVGPSAASKTGGWVGLICL